MGIRTFAKGAIVGWVLAYLSDRESGRGRRARLRDQATSMARRARDRAGKLGRHGGNVLVGKLRAAASPPEDRGSTDDVTIADRIKSEVLGRKDLRAGSLLVDVTDGVAHLRGRMDDASRLERVIDLTGEVRGVREVDNLIEVA